ncbi:hypothetical protein HMPREF0682_2494 [Propionibacterium acidifaciens F0233]|uniref:Uncharacterized protein n=1 Tax=Propionibacterium acidifaciens F0233 TaxID=553198 RepID=U2PJ31_9ACTN|nr:hypothetical protein HMPREF0682_2494 [Propionibacterium acidifaciens F0233]
MEPGHEDREYLVEDPGGGLRGLASMEPGHEDREYYAGDDLPERGRDASMEPGHEDREYSVVSMPRSLASASLNGARS